MLRRFSERLTYANVASTLALVIAVGGGGAAVALVANNSVGSPQIIDGAVKSRDIGASQVKSGDVLNRTLKHVDLTAGKIGVVRGYAYIGTPSPTLDTPVDITNSSYSYNSSGGAVSFTRFDPGKYTVSFAGINVSGGNVQITSYGSTDPVFCKVTSWSVSTAAVACFDDAGAVADSRFAIAMIE